MTLDFLEADFFTKFMRITASPKTSMVHQSGSSKLQLSIVKTFENKLQVQFVFFHSRTSTHRNMDITVAYKLAQVLGVFVNTLKTCTR